MSTPFDLPTPAMHHRRHSRVLVSLIALIQSCEKIEGYSADEAVRFLDAMARLINHDPALCYRIEAAARGEMRP